MSRHTATRTNSHRTGTVRNGRVKANGGPTATVVALVRDVPPIDDAPDVDVFEDLRPKLLNVAYRMLGSFSEAEDIVQEAWIRWAGRDRATVDSPQKYLVTIVSRLSIDRMRMAYRRRETYIGPYLPEPIYAEAGQDLGPEHTVEQRETLSVGMLRILQQLTAPERAVFVLREAFALPYDEIADLLDVTTANARQLHRRGSKRLGDDRKRFDVDPNVHRHLVDRFTLAAQTGQRDVLQGLLAHDVTMWTDGGGKVSVALRPVFGAERVARLILGTFSKHTSTELQVAALNYQPGLLISMSDNFNVCTFEVTDGLISGIQWLANPDKLSHLVAASCAVDTLDVHN
ncbi:RNA polymerase sigma-70 factor [Alloalcanivorax gelatiniphagus]